LNLNFLSQETYGTATALIGIWIDDGA